MQVDSRFFQITMPQQNLDGSQVRAGFEQMCGEAVSTMPQCGIVATMPLPGLCRELARAPPFILV